MKRAAISFVIGLVLIANLFAFSIVYAEQPVKVDKHNPVYATDVELAMKITVAGTPKAAPADKPQGNKPGKTAGAATGTLGSTVSGNRYAIIIGISDYPGTGSDLQYSDDDARDMYAALTGNYSFAASNIISLIDQDATRANIISAIETIEGLATTNDEVVFFFSGHGGRGKANDGDNEATDECIWAHDNSKLVPIWDGELKTAFAGYGTSRIVFIFDSCYSGGMTDLQKDGRVIAMASAENSLSYEWSSLSNGEFTYYMIEQGVSLGKADKYDSASIPGPDVTVEEAYDYANANRIRNTPTISDKFQYDLLP